MVRFKICLFVTLFATFHLYGQLNKFMVQTYFYGEIPPWNTTSSAFFGDLKNTYNFNNVLFITNTHPYANDLYKSVKKAGLHSVLYLTSLNSRKPVFDRNAILQDMTKYSGAEYDVMGYHITDEPDAKTSYWPYGVGRTEQDGYAPFYEYIDNIPQYTNEIRIFDAKLLRYANLYPQCVFTDKDYRNEYIQRYIDDSNPNLLSFDHYPIFSNSPAFFLSLYDIALKSTENSIPFIYVLTPHEDYGAFEDEIRHPDFYHRAKNMAQFNYVIYAALAYGAKGISYWPGFQWVYSIHGFHLALNYENGVLGNLSSLHKKLTDNSEELLSLNFVEVL